MKEITLGPGEIIYSEKDNVIKILKINQDHRIFYIAKGDVEIYLS